MENRGCILFLQVLKWGRNVLEEGGGGIKRGWRVNREITV